jgi:4-amino-4-deoxy-L-arabinose transferase-like glycosyltransferase
VNASVRALSAFALLSVCVGLYLPTWAPSFRTFTWPPTVGTWNVLYTGVTAAIGLLALLQGGRLLLTLNGLAVVLLLGTTMIAAGTAPALAILGWLLFISVGLGNLGLKLLAPTVAWSTVDRLTFSLLLGFGALAGATAGLGLLGLLHLAATIPTLALLMLPVAWRLPVVARRLRCGAVWVRPRWWGGDLRLPAAALAYLSLCFIAALLWALAPSVLWDALAVHLPLPAKYAAEHAFVEFPDYVAVDSFGLGHALFTLGFVLGGQPLPTLFHFTFGLVTTGLVFSMARRLAGPVAGWVAAVGFASMPLVTWEAGTALIDLFVTGYTFACMYALLRWWQDDQAEWLVVAGVLGGLAAATKLNAGLFLAPAALLATLVGLVRARRRPQALGGVLGLYLALALIALPWFVASSSAQDRILPFFKEMFQGARLGFPPGLAGYGGLRTELLSFLRLPYDLVVDRRFAEWGRGALGIVPLLALASVVAGPGVPWRLRLPMLFLGLAAVFLWFRIAQVSRYLLPIMPLLTVLAVLPLPDLLKAINDRGGARRLAFTCALLGLVYLAATRGVYSIWPFQIPEGHPYRLALGLETRETFLARALPPYRAFQFLDDQNSAARVLSVGAPFRWVYIKSQLEDPRNTPSAGQLAELPPDAALARKMESLGYRFILADWGYIRANRGWDGFAFLTPHFLHDFTHLEFAYRDVYVYRIRAERDQASAAEVDLVTNGSFDEPSEGEQPAA